MTLPKHVMHSYRSEHQSGWGRGNVRQLTDLHHTRMNISAALKSSTIFLLTKTLPEIPRDQMSQELPFDIIPCQQPDDGLISDAQKEIQDQLDRAAKASHYRGYVNLGWGSKCEQLFHYGLDVSLPHHLLDHPLMSRAVSEERLHRARMRAL